MAAVRVCVGPVAPTSAEAWIGWAREMIEALREQPEAPVKLPAQVLDDVEAYVESWAGANRPGDVFQWQVDVDPDELEYLTNSLYNLDLRLADEAAPAEARAFHIVLVQALLFALAQESPSRAAFVEQLRPSWPVVVEAR
ncbi:MAG TPA: hypothetical protein VGV86_08705 [Acidimicrobiales bacterium]|nr:hypothetical protein [Acidimicrobiales bacterium]